MSTAFIFKHLLDVLKIESNLDGEGSGEIGKEWLPHLVQSCAALRDAAMGKETTNKDRLVILPKVLKCFSRLLNKAISIPLSEIKHPKLVETILEGTFNLLSTLNQADKETRALLQKAMVDEQSSVLMIFLHLITIFEVIGKKNSGSEFEDEHLTEISLQLYNAILVSVYTINEDAVSIEHSVNVENHKLNHVFSGALATQTIQSLLTFCNHKSKRINTEAASDLLYTLRCFKPHREVWRTCFPGAFSGLFVLTQSGYKSGSGLLSRVLSALLELTYIVTEDSVPENVQLLTYLYTQTIASGDEVATTASTSNALFTNMLQKANTIPADTQSCTVTPTTSSSVQSTDACLAKEFRSVSEYVQWRVQVLQRIQLPLAAAFREVMKLCSPLQRVKLVTQLGWLLSHCSTMLGSLCVSECLCELLNTMLDTTPIVRDTTHSVWSSIQSSIKSNVYATSEYSKILDALGRKYFSLVGTLHSSIKLCQEARIKDQLGAVLGIGYGIHDHIVNIVRLHSSGGAINSSNSNSSVRNTSNNSIIKCISALYMPDPAVCGVRVTASVLETRSYTYHTHEDVSTASTRTAHGVHLTSVESGYYRVAWKHVQDNICKEYAGRWALYLGRYGLLEDIVASASKHIERYEQNTGNSTNGKSGDDASSVGSGTTEGATTTSTSLRSHHTAGVVGCLRLLGTALLGLAPVQCAVAVADRANTSNNNEAKTTARTRLSIVDVCGHCGRSSNIGNTVLSAPTTKMLRCSRCKSVHYCNKQHQALDWPTHKLTCKAAEAPPAPAANPTTAVPTIVTTEQAVTADVNIPTELLTNSHIRITTKSTPQTLSTASVLYVYSAAKRDYLVQRSVQLLLNIMQDYLFNRNNTITTNATTSKVPTTHVLVVAAAVEGIANIAFSAGPEDFQKYLMKLLYPLLELLVDTDPIVKQAAKCTLQRIALYSEQTSLSGLIMHNLDYIVDKICLQLRSPSASTKYSASSTSNGGSSDGNNASTHLIVDFVFSTLDSTVQDSSEGSNYSNSEADAELAAPMYLLRDVICDSLQSIDAYSLHSVYSTMQLTALLRVLRVLACRAAAAPSVREFVSGGTDSNKSASDLMNTNGNDALLRVSKHLQDKIFQKSTITPIMSTTDTTTRTPTAASLAAQSLLDFTRNLYNLNFEDSHVTDSEDTDPSADLLNAERIRAEQDRQNEQNIAEEHEQDINSTAPPSASVQLLLDVVHRCCVFLTLQHASSQVIVIETLCAAFVRLSVHNGQYKQHLLPCIHSTWPVVINRIHELVTVLQSTEAQAVHSTLSTVHRGAGAGAKVKNGSSALLGLENSLSHVSLSNVGGSTGPISGNSAGLTAISSTTRSAATLNTQYTSSINTSSGTASSATPTTDQRAQLHVLPHVFDLVAILTVAGREFMTIKLKQELLPELYALLVFYLQQCVHISEGRVISKKSGASSVGSVRSIVDVAPTKVFSRSQLLITSADNNNTVTATSKDQDVNTSTSERTVAHSNTDRFSLHSKIKLSLLGLLTQLCTTTTTDVQIVRYMTTQVAPLVYLTLPLMGALECEEVREAAHGLLTLLHKLDSAGTNTILRSILDSKTSPAEKDDVKSVQAMQTWRALHFTPSIVAAFNASSNSTSSRSSGSVGVDSDIVLTMYHSDSSLMKQLKDILCAKQNKPRNESNSGGGSANCLWIQKLSLWSTV
eukprot:gene13457-15493_t